MQCQGLFFTSFSILMAIIIIFPQAVKRTLFMLCIISLGDLLKEELPHIYHLVEVAHKPVSMK